MKQIFPHSDSLHAVAKGARLYGIGFFGKLGGPLFLLLASRLYGPASLGLFFAAWAYIQVVMRLSTGGIAEALQLYLPRLVRSKNGTVTLSSRSSRLIASAFQGMLLSAILGMAGLWLLFYFLGGMLQLSVPKGLLFILLPCILFQSLIQFSVSVQKALLSARTDVWVNSFLKELLPPLFALSLIGTPASAYPLGIIQSLTYALASAWAIWALIKNPLLSKSVKHLYKWNLDLAFLKRCFPLGLNDLMLYLTQELDMLMLAAWGLSVGSVTESDLGFYGVAISIAFTARMFRMNYTRLFQPLAVQLAARLDWDHLRKAYALTLNWVWLWVLGFVGIIILCAPLILSLYHPQYESYWPCLLILSLGPIVNGLFGMNTVLLLAKNKIRWQLTNQALTVFFNFALNLILIPRFGIYGAAIATASSMIFMQVILALQLHKLSLFAFPWNSVRCSLRNFIVIFSISLFILIVLHYGLPYIVGQSIRNQVDWLSQGISASFFISVYLWVCRKELPAVFGFSSVTKPIAQSPISKLPISLFLKES